MKIMKNKRENVKDFINKVNNFLINGTLREGGVERKFNSNERSALERFLIDGTLPESSALKEAIRNNLGEKLSAKLMANGRANAIVDTAVSKANGLVKGGKNFLNARRRELESLEPHTYSKLSKRFTTGSKMVASGALWAAITWFSSTEQYIFSETNPDAWLQIADAVNLSNSVIGCGLVLGTFGLAMYSRHQNKKNKAISEERRCFDEVLAEKEGLDLTPKSLLAKIKDRKHQKNLKLARSEYANKSAGRMHAIKRAKLSNNQEKPSWLESRYKDMTKAAYAGIAGAITGTALLTYVSPLTMSATSQVLASANEMMALGTGVGLLAGVALGVTAKMCADKAAGRKTYIGKAHDMMFVAVDKINSNEKLDEKLTQLSNYIDKAQGKVHGLADKIKSSVIVPNKVEALRDKLSKDDAEQEVQIEEPQVAEVDCMQK